MFGALQLWFSALPTLAKLGLVSMAVVTGGAATNVLPSEKAALVTPHNPEIIEKEITCAPTVSEVNETSAIPYEKRTENDPSVDSGKTVIKVAGAEGVKTLTYESITYLPEGCMENNKRLINEAITTPPVTEVTAIGTYVAPQPPENDCDPNYSPCITHVSYDLDCSDIGISVRVIGSDPHRFDRDNDSYGCESY